MPNTEQLNELADLARGVLVSHCRAIDMTLPDDPTTVFRAMIEAILDEAAAQAWIEKQLAETGLKSMDFRNGMTMDIEPAREMVAQWVGAARAMLGDAPNYTETPVEMVVKVGESPERFAFTLQRVGNLTPHQARQNAEAALATVLQLVSAWCVEANENGGVDAGDLAFRLERAGHPLPETEGGS